MMDTGGSPRSRADSGGSRSRTDSAGRAIGTVQLVPQHASDLPTVETSAPQDGQVQSGVQIVVTGPDNIARSVIFERTDKLSEAFEIMQQAGMLPSDPLPWNPENQPLSREAQLRAQRMSDEFSFNLGEGVAPSALISSAELETGGTRRSGDIKQTMQTIDMPTQPQMSAKDHQRMSDLYDMGRLSDQFNRLSAEFEWSAPSGDQSPNTSLGQQQQQVVGVEPADSVPPEFLGMEMDPDRISDPRISDRCSSMDPQVLNTLIQHSANVRQQASQQHPRQAAPAQDVSIRRTSSDLMWEIMADLDPSRVP